MILFAVFATLLAALLLARLFWPGRQRREVSAREANIAIYRDQLRELDADLAAGKLAREDHERSRREVEGRLLEDVAAAEAAVPARRAALPWAAGAAIPLLA